MAIAPRQLGHVVINVRDLDRSERFYTRVMGLHVNEKRPGRMVFMSARPNTSHELALISVGDEAAGPEEGRAGMVHMAWEMESFEDLRAIYQVIKEANAPILRIGDHGISLGVYFQDPDGNEMEVFYELPKEQWPKGDVIFGVDKFPMTLEDAVDVPTYRSQQSG